MPDCDSQRRFSLGSSLSSSLSPPSLYYDHESPPEYHAVQPLSLNLRRNYPSIATLTGAGNAIANSDRISKVTISDSDPRNVPHDRYYPQDRAPTTTLHPGTSAQSIYQTSEGASGVFPGNDYRWITSRSLGQFCSTAIEPDAYNAQEESQLRHHYDPGLSFALTPAPGLSESNQDKTIARFQTLPCPFPPLSPVASTSSLTPPQPLTDTMPSRTTKSRMARSCTVNPPLAEPASEVEVDIVSSEALPQVEPSAEPQTQGRGTKRHGCPMCHKSFDRPRYAWSTLVR